MCKTYMVVLLVNFKSWIIVYSQYGMLENFKKGFCGGSAIKNPPAGQETQEMSVGSLGEEDPLEGNLLQYSWQANSLDRGDWLTMVHGIVKNWTHTKWLSMQAHMWTVYYHGRSLGYICTLFWRSFHWVYNRTHTHTHKHAYM